MNSLRPLPVIVVTAVVALSLTNAFWLFPHEGATQYRYERASITVENDSGDMYSGRLSYSGSHGERYEQFEDYNDLTGLGCQLRDAFSDDGGWGCAFDRYLMSEGEVRWDGGVTVEGRHLHIGVNRWVVEIDGAYYKRVLEETNRPPENTTTTYRLEQFTPEEVLDYLAEDYLPTSGEERTLLVTGDSVTVFDEPADDTVGIVYRVGGQYYTIIVVEKTLLDRPIISPTFRSLLGLVGLGVGLAFLARLGILRVRSGPSG